ncbi:hypothetical protein GBAR_LOCUS18335 [Geodia barretti]|uniref:Uncharacterized protein n=1 Tax=Geodia barretti TaxID=519541 RepID=A0AA35SMT4_GEOBA|nr:hypothetical protein GBAR_LOCUS18335 [Geodia barretti]
MSRVGRLPIPCPTA